MRIARLADLVGSKYELISIASLKNILDQVKDDILTNYKGWVMGKYKALKILAENHGIPEVKELYAVYNDLVANIDNYTPVQLFNRVNKILGLIHAMKTDPDKKYRQNIHNSVAISRESDKNYREQLKSGFETNLSNISFGLEKAAKRLRAFVPEVGLAGGAVEPQRKELSKEKLLMFMKTPAAQFYGLDNMDVMTQILSYPETREKVTTLINAIDRHHIPADGQEVMEETRAIKSWIENKEKTNLPALEQEPSFEEEK